jgi:hypothetical protein
MQPRAGGVVVLAGAELEAGAATQMLRWQMLPLLQSALVWQPIRAMVPLLLLLTGAAETRAA